MRCSVLTGTVCNVSGFVGGAQPGIGTECQAIGTVRRIGRRSDDRTHRVLLVLHEIQILGLAGRPSDRGPSNLHSRKFTVPEFIGDRFYSRTARGVAVVCLIICSVTYVIGQMKGIGVAFSRFLEVDYATGLLVGMCIVFFYAVLGGMKGITYTQIAQYVVLILAYTIPAIFISLQLTGNAVPQLGLGSTMAGSEVYLLDRLDQVVMDLGFKEYTTDVRLSKLNMFAHTLSLMIGTAGLPHVIIRFLPSLKSATRELRQAGR